MKLIYKKSLMVELVKLGHDLEYTARNRNNPQYQVYFSPHSKAFDQDIAMLTGNEYIDDERAVE
ncbi:hypothetical protein JSQ81_02960 [Sporosarcina sp. Marseille-Q4063]|uniref:hypothetical protein n=1 Tax=Sporosarcina sp. Marseille-Q4063 TaxID=2810514 RepID=UPI001BAEEC23|nr:hypothetical protein [Sporosarcina sp. Marseille-Q4063]QUW22563.1 hypothetical protein JSQ81_02960 [Sporosarcina sp. Marseille-Q4063]